MNKTSCYCLFIVACIAAAQLPTKQVEVSLMSPLRSKNMCAYKNIRLDDGTNSLAWICGPPNSDDDNIQYDCCSGFLRSELMNNECFELMSTYEEILPTLEKIDKPKIATILHDVVPELNELNSNQDYTVFVPENDAGIIDQSSNAVKKLVANGRYYVDVFTDNSVIPVEEGSPLKISKSSNGLVFVECKILIKPDIESSNGLIHITSGPIASTEKFPTVMQRLQVDPKLKNFVADIPNDLKIKLSASSDQTRFTIFAPDNNAWNFAKQKISGQKAISDLVKQHIFEKIHCANSFNNKLSPIGKNLGGAVIKAQNKSTNQPVLVDTCGTELHLIEKDNMAGNGVVHTINGAIQTMEGMNLREALECLSKNPDSNIGPTAKKMSACNINVEQGEGAIVLLPTTNSKDRYESSCDVFAHHVLTSTECSIKQDGNVGVPQECHYATKYTAPNGQKPGITNQYIRDPTGSILYFGQIKTSAVNPIKFRDGVIYSVESMNKLPTQTVMEIISKDPKLKTTYNYMKTSKFFDILKKKAPNFVFFAPQNHGWISRDVENAYNSLEMQKFFSLHTSPHQLITGSSGNINPETIQTVNSLSSIELKLRRNLDGNTFIGHDKLDTKLWSMAIGEPRIGTDGVVWSVDWPMVCPNC